MRLLDGYEDFKTRTLARIPGRLGKALFMRGCRRTEGYAHWGMLNLYGKVQGTKILRGIDREVHLEVLRTPMDELLEEMQISTDSVEISALSRGESEAAVLGKAGSRHLELISETLGAMAASENQVA